MGNSLITFKSSLDKRKTSIAQMIPASMGVSPERFIQFAYMMVAQTPALERCDGSSLMSSIMQAARLGLMPDPVLGHVYIIPYGNKAQIQIGYKGMISLAWRAGIVITARVVHDGDAFDYAFGTNEYINHVPSSSVGERELTHSYAIARLGDGQKLFVVCEKSDIENAKKSSQGASRADSPWKKHPDAMWKKTAIRRLAATLPLATEFSRAVAIDEMPEYGKLQPIDTELEDVEILPNRINVNQILENEKGEKE